MNTKNKIYINFTAGWGYEFQGGALGVVVIVFAIVVFRILNLHIKFLEVFIDYTYNQVSISEGVSKFMFHLPSKSYLNWAAKIRGHRVFGPSLKNEKHTENKAGNGWFLLFFCDVTAVCYPQKLAG